MNGLIARRCCLAMVLAAAPLSAQAQSPTWPDPIALDVLPYATAGVAHGPLLGNVTTNSVRVWLRTREAEDFEVVYDRRLPLAKNSPLVLGKVDPNKDRIGVVQLVGLKPNTRYYYGVRINGQLADLREGVRQRWPSFRTLPDDTACRDPLHNPRGLFNVTFAIGHCASQEVDKSGGHYASTPAYDTIL
ncbi:MAG: hypothetical protein QGF59_21280, partial [Pirellulaceae bacterium]|nr:hypothetical protein [Pirellulaceae bacterium]